MLLFSHPACLEHDPGEQLPGHPDAPERLLAIERLLEVRDWLGWERRAAPAASEDEVRLIHRERLVRSIADLCTAGGGAIDADTFARAVPSNVARNPSPVDLTSRPLNRSRARAGIELATAR